MECLLHIIVVDSLVFLELLFRGVIGTDIHLHRLGFFRAVFGREFNVNLVLILEYPFQSSICFQSLKRGKHATYAIDFGFDSHVRT